MAADHSTDFQAYLQFLCTEDSYRDWQDFYTPTDTLDRQRAERKNWLDLSKGKVLSFLS